MATNGKTTDEPELTEAVDQVLQDMKDYGMAEIEPIEPKEKVKFVFTRKREREYFKSINWAEWWDEFNGGRQKNGKRLYDKISDFIQSKTKQHWQQELLRDAIGPEPRNKLNRRVPWLGDWHRIRRNGFYVFDDPVKAQAVEIALRQKHELISATRALAPHIARRLAYWYRIKDMITEGLVGKLMDEDTVKLVHVKGSKKPKEVVVETREYRVEKFMMWQERVEKMILRLEDQWMKAHGVDPHEVGQQWVTSAALAGQIGAAAALTGAAVASNGRPMLTQDGVDMPLPEGITYDSLLFAQHLKDSSQRYNLPLPEEQKANGKAKQKAQ